MKFSLKSSLLENDSIQLDKIARDWEDAITIGVTPLVKSGAVSAKYGDAIIASTKEYGPYYILMPGMAMPHAAPSSLIVKDSFSLTILREPIIFPDESEVSVLLILAATSGEAHTTVAIPQVISLFQLDDIKDRLVNANSVEEITELLNEAEVAAVE